MAEQILIAFDLTGTSQKARSAFKQSLQDDRWRSSLEYAPDDWRYLPDTTLIGPYSTEEPVLRSIEKAVLAGERADAGHMHLGPIVGSRFTKIVFNSPKLDTVEKKLDLLRGRSG